MSREEHPFLKIQLILIMIGENRQKKANGGKLVFFLFFFLSILKSRKNYSIRLLFPSLKLKKQNKTL
jgi:hypothetical protein